jgi:hypothetical protein
MKKRIGILVLAIALIPLAANAQRKRLNLVGSLGMATSNIEGLIISLGVEVELFQNFYAQLGFDNFFDGGSTMAYSMGGQVSFPQTVRTQVFGLNLSGIYKLPLTRQVSWFTKGGLAYTHRARYPANSYYYDSFDSYGYGGGFYDYYPDSYYYEDQAPIRTGLAYALGTGIEYQIGEKLALIGGGTYESLFQGSSSSDENGKRGDWVKMYVGISYRLK